MTNRLTLLALHLAIFFVLMYGYQYYIVPIFGYEGFVFHPDQDARYLAIAAVMLLSLLTPVSEEKPSTVFYHLILTTLLFPMLVLFYAAGKPWEYIAQVLLAYLLCVALPRFMKVKAPAFRLVSDDKLRRGLFMLTGFYIASIFVMGGGSYLNFDFSKVYDFRDEASGNLPGVFGYLSPLVAKVIVPIAFVLSLLHKRYLMALAMLGSAVLIFGLTSHKSTLFAPLMLLFIYLVSRGENLIRKLNTAILVILLLSIADFWLRHDADVESAGWVGALMMRRVFFIPGELNYLYYDFFSRNDWVLFSNSKITLGLLDYKYPLEVAYLIGLEYFGSPRLSANTGWFGAGYMQLGLAGLLLYGALIAFVFKYIDACARKSGERGLVTAAVTVPILAMLSSTDLPTAFLTNGLYLNLLLIACFNKRQITTAYAGPARPVFA
jgi:hypothetical protein